jgi:core-2/I-Branching enzyme
MSLAYLIRAHHRPAQLARLVDRLSTRDARFYVHVDAKASKETYTEMRRALAGRDDVHWAPRVKSYYAGFSLVRSTLSALGEIAPIPDHVVLLSGQDYPLRPAEEIEQALAARVGESLVEHFRIPAYDRWPDEDGGFDRIRYLHFERVHYRTRILRIPLLTRSWPEGLEPYGGSAWGVLSAEAVRTILAFPERHRDTFLFFRHVKTPDEMFLQTVLVNSPERNRVANESIHYIEWPGGSHPATFGQEDFPRLAASGMLFARKFDVEQDAEILDLIDRELLGQASPVPG